MQPEGIWIGLGGNQAGSEVAIEAAIAAIGKVCRLRQVSSLYISAPCDFLDQADFFNVVAEFDQPQSLSPGIFLEKILEMEITLGRQRLGAIPKGPRLIDLDLLLFGALVLQTPTLVLPHPAMHLRRFVLEPLLELAPELQEPITGRYYLDYQKLCLDQTIYSKRPHGYTT